VQQCCRSVEAALLDDRGERSELVRAKALGHHVEQS
jgi:hypothetical protein